MPLHFILFCIIFIYYADLIKLHHQIARCKQNNTIKYYDYFNVYYVKKNPNFGQNWLKLTENCLKQFSDSHSPIILYSRLNITGKHYHNILKKLFLFS